MIPISIELVNFRAIPYALIDLSSVTIAAICGRNGAGKSSAFTLAPIFSLFGDKIKGISMDDLVRKGTQEMAVTFTFEHQDSIYRTIRTRSIKGNGKSTLELQQKVNEQWESRSAEKIKDTEDIIRNLLNLDAETFTASSMILQGKANEFTAQTAGKRKEILQQVLGLNIYDQLLESARHKSATLNIEIERAKSKLTDLNETLAVKEEKDELLAEHKQQLAETSENLNKYEADLKLLQIEVIELQAKSTKAAELAKQSFVLFEEITLLGSERSGLVAKLDRAEKILQYETQIIEKSKEALVVQEKITILQTKAPRSQEIQAEQVRIQAEITKIETDSIPIVGQIASLTKLIANKSILDVAAAEFVESISSLEKLDKLQMLDQEKHSSLLVAQELSSSTRLQFENKKKALDERIRVLTGKTVMLADSNCIDVTIAACHFLSDAQKAKAELILANDEVAKLDPIECNILENAYELLLNERKALDYDQMVHLKLKERVNQLRPLSEQAGQLDAKVELLTNLEAQMKRFEESKLAAEVRLHNLNEESGALLLELVELPDLQQKLVKIMEWAVLKDQLATSIEIRGSATERIAAIDLEVTNKTNRRNGYDVDTSLLVLETIEFEAKKQMVPVYEQQIKAAREQQGILQVRIGGLQTELKAFEDAEAERKRITTYMEPLVKEWTRYQTLIKAFGKDGIPALIIENAVPALEKIANEILGKMSKGKHSLRFETQRELKSKDGIAETLDIMIGDWSGERPYETFSGGEQLRIDFAIRFALAELLACRAGSKVEWLTIDEGLGSQDGEHRALVLESIKAVADRFKKVLVITHIEEAQSVFDQRIYFENSDAGINIQVA
ncbi:SMC family ATPase [Paenibacillus psychroresistens]|uniref:Nuclease SbcCD subunit C n=1 Tax=Paenibacillus psychroresistens TaxID=1778678 RepID=A0A6B8RKF7_9BACL|nr:SMC family ATPase [Paenibacillus psychroresistens]QGQ95838.1 SMC family ATPase [Paenibacillus psychroresistens]